MNIGTEQVFIVNTTELDQQNNHIPTPLQQGFTISGTALQAEEAQTSMCLPQSMDPPSRTRMCRLCATVTNMVVPIFQGEGLQNNLADKIHQHLTIQVSEDDLLPVVMCFQCTSTLLAWHELVICSVQADSVMRERFNLSYSQHQQQQQLNKQSSLTQIKDEKGAVKTEYELDCEETRDSDDSDRPLASLAHNKRTEFLKFYEALVRFRKHVAAEHGAPPASESSGSEAVVAAGVDAYDDLTERNRRRSRLEAGARETAADGRVLFRCATCGKRLSSAHTLLFHRRIHTGERPCVCHVCGAQFRAPPGLQRHLHETHERRRRLPCRACRGTFANAQNLKQHMRIHTGERPHACAVCGKTFAQSGSLHAHGAVHRAARPHACAECGAAFRLRGALARHRLRHSGERPHACALCPRAFRTRHEARTHAAAHGDARPHACRVCPAAFRARRALRQHQKRLHHLDTPLPPPPPHADLAPPCSLREARACVRCEHCAGDFPDTRLRAHLLAAHAPLLFLCAECQLYRSRGDMISHMATHIDRTKDRKIPEETSETKQSGKLIIPVVRIQRLSKLTAPPPLVETSVTSSLDSIPLANIPNSSIGSLQPVTIEPPPLQKIESKLLQRNISLNNLKTESSNIEKEDTESKNDRTSDQNISKEMEKPPSPRLNEFSDHSDSENEFGQLPESVFDAIEDSQDANDDQDSQKSAKKPSLPRPCPICGKQCNSLSGWYYHLKLTHGTNNKNCGICNRVFASKSELATHIRTHTKEKPFECRTCSSEFTSRAGRYIHEQTHAGTRGHACGRCPRAFRWRAQLKRHQARHDAIKTHICPQCGRGFSVAFDLLRHIRAHTPGSHYCDICSATFKQKRYLKVHMENKHLALISTSVSSGGKINCENTKKMVTEINAPLPGISNTSDS